jgi:hypothetical protein
MHDRRPRAVIPVIVGIRSDPANEANIKCMKDYYGAIHPRSGGDGGYVNFMSSDDGHRAPARRQRRAARSSEGEL